MQGTPMLRGRVPGEIEEGISGGVNGKKCATEYLLFSKGPKVKKGTSQRKTRVKNYGGLLIDNCQKWLFDIPVTVQIS